MESLILESGIDYYIFRLPQVLGNGGNPNNLINYFKSKIISGVHFDIMADSYRSIIDVDDVLLISTHIVNNFNKNKIYNIAGIEFKKVSEIVIYLEEILLKKSNTSIIDKVSDIIKENSNEVEESINALSINRKDYIKNILQKYVTDIRRDK
jgi:nucleoside-diphosphate-sugar epimerase